MASRVGLDLDGRILLHTFPQQPTVRKTKELRSGVAWRSILEWGVGEEDTEIFFFDATGLDLDGLETLL